MEKLCNERLQRILDIWKTSLQTAEISINTKYKILVSESFHRRQEKETKMISKLQMTQFFPTLQCGSTNPHHKWGCDWLVAYKALGRPRNQVFWLNQAFNHSCRILKFDLILLDLPNVYLAQILFV